MALPVREGDGATTPAEPLRGPDPADGGWDGWLTRGGGAGPPASAAVAAPVAGRWLAGWEAAPAPEARGCWPRGGVGRADPRAGGALAVAGLDPSGEPGREGLAPAARGAEPSGLLPSSAAAPRTLASTRRLAAVLGEGATAAVAAAASGGEASSFASSAARSARSAGERAPDGVLGAALPVAAVFGGVPASGAVAVAVAAAEAAATGDVPVDTRLAGLYFRGGT